MMYDHALTWLDAVKKRPNAYNRLRVSYMKFYCFFHTLLVLLFIIVYMVVRFVNYVFLLLCMFHSRYCVSFCCSMYCLCVNVYCATATGSQPNCSYQICHIIILYYQNSMSATYFGHSCRRHTVFIIKYKIILNVYMNCWFRYYI
jgi:hypothetical protein